MISKWMRRGALAALSLAAVVVSFSSVAQAQHGHRGHGHRHGHVHHHHHHHGHGYGSNYGGTRAYYGTTVRSYRPSYVTPRYGYGYNTIPGYGASSLYRSYRPASGLGGYGVGGYPIGPSYGGGGFNLYIGR